ncbi:VOC family protein [Parahaliea aestuarii]|uniref:VOC family protein n=1 Tax=Parahaliea aestuarii TaxID=1852021 RepID=A0A5C8ZVR2_9GAMM|nr:VOC family protein [Parahaliea aestuarii]TXS92613.1 VOC family protein [Parahaliea aestuarii]
MMTLTGLYRLVAAGLAGAALLAGCTATGFSLPGVSSDYSGGRLAGKVVWHDLLSDTPARTEAFYSGLFGWEFEALPLESANYTLIRHQGRLIGGMVDQNELPIREDVSQWVVVISVADLEAAVNALDSAGGKVLTPPTSLGERGDLAVVTDPEGAAFALLETRHGDPADGGDRPASGDFLWDELWAGEPEAAGNFYRKALGYGLEQRELGSDQQPLSYTVFNSAGQPRAGLRGLPVEGLKPTWVSYVRVADAAELESILSRVEGLGGRILVPATDRPAGGRVALIAGPSGAGIALQTWDNSAVLGMQGDEE